MKKIKNKIAIGALSGLLLCSCGDFLEPSSTSEFVPKDASSLNELLLGEAYPRNDIDRMNIFLNLMDDLGPTPFGHAGEDALSRCLGKPFRHNEQSLRVVDVLEKNGDGLNLSYEVRMGILTHTGAKQPETLEARIVRYADQIAYVNHDIDDATRAGILSNDDIPRDIRELLGYLHKERINTVVCDIIGTARRTGELSMSHDIHRAHHALREFMFERVYRDSWRAAEENRCDGMMKQLFAYYSEHPGEMPEEFVLIGYREGTARAVCDFLSCMTDRYAIELYRKLFIPEVWRVK